MTDTTYHAQRIRATEAAYNRAVASLRDDDAQRYSAILEYRTMAQNDAQLAQRVHARCAAIMADRDDALADVLWSEKRYTAALAAVCGWSVVGIFYK